MSVVAILLLELLAIATINISFCSGSAYVGCIKSEREALLRFKQDLKDPANRLASWTADGDCCTWTGVVCSNYTGHVQELRLENPLDLSNKAYEKSKLAGAIPIEVTDLEALRSLNLSHNNFTGRIPEDIGAMKSLESIDFSVNQISGEIPQSMSNLMLLSYLNLSTNHLSGRIPSSGQFQTFGASSFMGNNLCGFPLPDKCSAP